METERMKTLLETEIRDDLEGLSGLALGSEEYKAAVSDITKLMDRAIELSKVDDDAIDKAEKRQMEESMKQMDLEIRNRELCLKETQLEIDKKDKFVGHVIAVVGIVIPAVLTVWGTCKTLKFDQTDTITPSMGRGFINKLLPKK